MDKKQEYTAEEKAELIKSKSEHFAKTGRDSKFEFDEFKPCDKCQFLNPNCHKTCGVILKYINRA